METHSLAEPWSFWFTYIPPTNQRFITTQAFSNKLMLISTFDNIKEFLKVYNYMPKTHTLQNATYYYFKKSVQPKWEDPRNSSGFIIDVILFKNKLSKAERKTFEEVWCFLLFLLLGNARPDITSAVNGVVCKIRPMFLKFELWCGAAGAAAQAELVKKLGELLPPFSDISVTDIAQYIAQTKQPRKKPRDRARRPHGARGSR